MTERKLVPKIRFKRFEEEWLKTDFGKIVFRNSATTDSKELRSVEYENINSEYGTVTKSYNNKKGIKFKKGDVLFGKLRPYLKNWILTCFEGKAVGDFWVLSSRKGFDSSFVFYLIQTNRFAFISNITTGTKMPRSDWNLVSNTSFDIPIRSEQQKIGALFAKLDRLLDLQQQKLEQLELLKKALLQKLFPKQDAKIPELRFKGVEDEWVRTRIKKIVQYSSSSFSISELKENNEGNTYPVYDATGTKYYSKKFDMHDDYIAIIKDGSNVGKTRLLPAKTSVLSTMGYLQALNSNILFDFYSITNTNFDKYKVGSGIPHIYFSDYKKECKLVPKIPEQQKIGNLLAKVDRLIEIENKKFSNLKLVKKSLLQNMFVE